MKTNQSMRRIRFLVVFGVFLSVTIFWMRTRGELEGIGHVGAGILALAIAGVAVAIWMWARLGRWR